MPLRKGAVGISIEGLSELVKRLEAEPIHARPWRRFLGRVSAWLKRQIRADAPVLTGRARRGVFYRLQGRPVPLWSVLSNRAARRGARYPFVLNAGHRRSSTGRDVVMHFRGTGRGTAGWFSDHAKLVPGLMRAAFPAFKRQIEAQFEGKNVD